MFNFSVLTFSKDYRVAALSTVHLANYFSIQFEVVWTILNGLSFPLRTYIVNLIVEKLGFFKKGKWIIYIYIIYLHYGNMLSKYKHQNIKTLGAFSHNIVFLYKSYIKK